MRPASRELLLSVVLPLFVSRVLYPYQEPILQAVVGGQDEAVLGGRQLGKDFTGSGGVAIELLTGGTPPPEWQVVSATQAHAQAFVRDVKQHLSALAPIAGIDLQFETDNARELVMPWGSRLVSHASSTRSIVGHRGSFLLNEVSAIPQAEAVFEAAYPIVTGARDKGRRAAFVLIGNAAHVGSFWHRAWTKGLPTFKRHQVRWSDALRQREWGPKAIARERSGIIGNIGADAFLQWYECEWRSDLGGMFPPEVITAAGEDYAEIPGWESWTQVLGMDVGRVNDPSTVTRLLIAPDGRLFAMPVVEMRGVAFAEQLATLRRLAQERPTAGILIDQTGNLSFVEQAIAELPEWSIGGFTFSATSKWQLFDNLLQALVGRQVHLCPGDLDTRMDLEGVKLLQPFGGVPQIQLPKDRRGHSDRAVSLALALACAQTSSQGPRVRVPDVSDRLRVAAARRRY